MDYSTIYKTAYSDLYKAHEILIKNEFQKGSDSNYPFIAIFDDISDILYQIKNQYKKEIKANNLMEIIDQFDAWKKKYSPDSKIDSEVNDKLLSFFNEQSLVYKLRLDYGQFLQQFAHYRAADDVIDAYYERKDYTQIAFEANMLEKYTLVPKKNEWESSKEYNRIKEKIHPDNDKTPNRAVESIPPEPKTKSNDAIKYADLIKKFTPQEKKFLLSVLFELTKRTGPLDNMEIPLTDFLKLSIITKEVSAIDIFFKRAYACGFYAEISKGIKAIKTYDRPKFLHALGEKLDELNMTKIASIIREYHQN